MKALAFEGQKGQADRSLLVLTVSTSPLESGGLLGCASKQTLEFLLFIFHLLRAWRKQRTVSGVPTESVEFLLHIAQKAFETQHLLPFLKS